jgi:hypothetical protein
MAIHQNQGAVTAVDAGNGAAQMESAQAELAQMIQLLLPFAIRGLATLGIADVLASGPAPVEEIAKQVGANTDALYRTMRYTASRGVFTELPGRVFALTPAAEYLRSDVPGSMREMLTIDDSMTSRLRMYTEVVHTLRTGEPAQKKVKGTGPVTKGAGGRQVTATRYHRLSSPQKKIDELIDIADFTADRSVVDVGGGDGRMIGTILAHHPQLTGVLLELPYAMEEAASVLDSLGVAQRCQTLSGDMFAEVPAGADTYLMSRVVHNWPDDKAVVVLANVRAAMPDHARLLIFEPLISVDGQQAAQVVQLDFMMLLNGGGRERSTDEHVRLLDRAGLRLARVTPAGAGLSVLEARPK